MKLADHLDSDTRRKLEKMGKKKKPPSKKKKRKGKVKEEKVNWPEIMGMDRDIYKRVNGALFLNHLN
ncbi:hypothetical protein CWO92_23615 [Heyndrickxia camelliae]|uniref:Uncharacterized protein n=1 Tax=Heyndrickxia camelliae TaxID=1707093 RepID=A0A2N3LDH4_9BACI|nr:hypothetical protein [Heyndrickxia camelliae]PKR82574.1 hypothetical protein CWO92_23615 [Heyndrickxia camelliae]